MRGIKAGFAAFAMAVGLGACSQGSGALGPVDVDAKSVEAHVAKLTSETIKGEATAAADLASLRALLPKEVSVTWAGLTFDAATAATVLTDVKVTPTDMPQVGLGIAELRLWDLDVELLKARMQGQRLDETAKLARRIDAKNVSVFGVAELVNGSFAPPPPYSQYDYPPAIPAPSIEAPAEAPIEEPANPLKFQQPEEPSIRDWPGFTEPEFFQDDTYAPDPDYYYDYTPPRVEKFDFSYGRLVLDDIVLKPFVAPASSQGGMTLSPMAALDEVLAVTRAFGIDSVAALDMRFDMQMVEGGQTISALYSVKSLGARGLRGSDLDASYARDIAYSFDLGADPSAPGVPRQMEFNIGFFGLEDLRLDKFYGELAKGEVPALSMTDLWSLGLWRSENVSMKMAGKQMFSAAETTLDARKFHWLVPTDLQASAKGVTIDFEAIASLAKSFDSGHGYDYGVQDFLDGVEVMKRHGLSKPSMNFAFGWNWNADNGDARLNLSLGGDGLINVDAKYEGGFPSYKAVTDLVPADPSRANMQALSRLFSDQSKLKLVEINLADNGGLGKIFALAADMGQQMGGFDMGLGPSDMSGDQLRETAALGIRSLAVQASGQFPEVRGLLEPVAGFLESGGRLRFAIQPGQPMPFAQMANVGMGAANGMLSPSQVIQQLGVRMEHSK
ncbi:MAG: hypothetical protein R3C46_07740 [Hyphomonadaceae bacterium]